MTHLDRFALFESKILEHYGFVLLCFDLFFLEDALEVVVESSVDVEAVGAVGEAEPEVRRLAALGHLDHEVPGRWRSSPGFDVNTFRERSRKLEITDLRED